MRKSVMFGLIVMLGGASLLFSCSADSDIDKIDTEVEILKEDTIPNPQLLSMIFSAALNPTLLAEDVKCEILGDSIVECWVPNLMTNKLLIPHIKYVGENIYIDEQSLVSDTTKVDFRKPTVLTINNAKGKSKKYTIYVHSFTGLPVLWIETEKRQEIASLEDYIPATYKLVEDVVTRGAGDIMEGYVDIRGRGNSTWAMPKKPYRLKFSEKLSFFGLPKNKHWVLLANYMDRSLIRNALCFFMGSLSNLDFTPRAFFVELMLNGRYNGTYQFTEALKIDKNRINIGDDGFLLEIDNKLRSNEVSFKTPHLIYPIRIHDPEVTEEDDDYAYIRDYMLEFEDALYSENFLNEESDYANYIDLPSFAEWYIISEILSNPESLGCSYFTKSKGGKLKQGPLWDFDLSVGNLPYADNDYLSFDPRVFFTKNYLYYPRLFEDPRFVKLVKERFVYFYDKKGEIFEFINNQYVYLKRSAVENDNRWDILYNKPFSNAMTGIEIWGSYENEIQYIKEFLNIRFEALKKQFENI